jgi:hypothetical protein
MLERSLDGKRGFAAIQAAVNQWYGKSDSDLALINACSQ